MLYRVIGRTGKGLIKSAFIVVAAVYASACASRVNSGVRPAIGTNYALQEAGLSAADQADGGGLDHELNHDGPAFGPDGLADADLLLT